MAQKRESFAVVAGRATPREGIGSRDAPEAVFAVPEGMRRACPPVDVVARVVDVRGPCPYGYRLGDLFRFRGDGTVNPSLCHVALNALRPFVARAQAGALVPQERVCCPVWDHLLVFEFQPAAQRRKQVTAA